MITNGVHIAFNLLMKFGTKLFSWITLSHCVLFIIDLAIWFKKTFTPTKGAMCACFHLYDFVSFDSVEHQCCSTQ
jgi:hypothetical protein